MLISKIFKIVISLSLITSFIVRNIFGNDVNYVKLPDGYTYEFTFYTQNQVVRDDTRFFVGEVSLYNTTLENQTLEYTQINDIDNEWVVNDIVKNNEDFANAIINKINGDIEGSVVKKVTTKSSNVKEYIAEVSPNSNIAIEKYNRGYSSGGTVVFKRYDNVSFAGYYSIKSDNWGWLPSSNEYVYYAKED